LRERQEAVQARQAPIIVVGLGNPGAQYEETRHNVGFMVLRALCARLRTHLVAGRGEYNLARTSLGSQELILLEPLTYVNNSGFAVQQALEEFSTAQENLLVVVDDFALPLGTLRLRPFGSDGGHNGLGSIIFALASDRFPRLRCGIAQESPPSKEVMRFFVLSPFESGERQAAAAMIERAAEAVLGFVAEGITLAMSRFNSQGTSSGTLSSLNP
jgi:PTH1 family peptidyl-tRNA hydrolase